jgi:hypothetical protein
VLKATMRTGALVLAAKQVEDDGLEFGSALVGFAPDPAQRAAKVSMAK